MDARPKRFRYTPFSSPQTQFRLLRLSERNQNPQTGGFQNYWRLENFDIDTCPPYNALSYTWGCPFQGEEALESTSAPIDWHSETGSIFINGHAFPVRRNLATFLDDFVCFQPALAGEYLWCDAISIDQQNMPERNAQVQIMAKIYIEASSSLVWLGPSDRYLKAVAVTLHNWDKMPISDVEIDRMDEVLSQLRHISSLGAGMFMGRDWEPTEGEDWRDKALPRSIQTQALAIQNGDCEFGDRFDPDLLIEGYMGRSTQGVSRWDVCKSLETRGLPVKTISDPGTTFAEGHLCQLRKLIQRAYWQRTWIIQELLLAKSISIFCGPGIFSLETFITALFLFEKMDHDSVQDWTTAFTYASALRRKWPLKFADGRNDIVSFIYSDKIDLGRGTGAITNGTLKVRRMSYNDTMNTACRFSDSQCTVPLDKVYGFLGLVEQREGSPSIIVDYKLSCEELFFQLVYSELNNTAEKLSMARDLASMLRLKEDRLATWVQANLSTQQRESMLLVCKVKLDGTLTKVEKGGELKFKGEYMFDRLFLPSAEATDPPPALRGGDSLYRLENAQLYLITGAARVVGATAYGRRKRTKRDPANMHVFRGLRIDRATEGLNGHDTCVLNVTQFLEAIKLCPSRVTKIKERE